MSEVKTCSREGCNRKIRGRGLCASHYTTWFRTKTVDTSLPDTRALIRDALPGTLRDIAEAAELTYETVRRTVKLMHAETQVHVRGSAPPSGKKGGRHVDIYADGPGQDRRVSKREKREYALARRRQQHFVKRAKRQPDPMLMITAGRAMEFA